MNLYQKRFFALLERPAIRAPAVGVPLTGRAANPLCGDEIELNAFVDDGFVRAVTHRVRGCALTRASATLLAETVVGGSPADAFALGRKLATAFSDRGVPLPDGFEAIAESRLLPARRRCVLLPWEALRDALRIREPE